MIHVPEMGLKLAPRHKAHTEVRQVLHKGEAIPQGVPRAFGHQPFSDSLSRNKDSRLVDVKYAPRACMQTATARKLNGFN